MQKVILFGASGNIGQQALEILKANQEKFLLTAFSVGQNDQVVNQILTEFSGVKMVYISNPNPKLAAKFPQVKFITTDICQLFEAPATIVINALSGFYGLKVTLTAITTNKIILNANKESFVTAGNLINELLQHSQAKIYPIDSEHCAIWQCLEANNPLEQIYLTASGGPFRNLSLAETKSVTLADALKHPNWMMGAKITIDSATMFNKAFEILEAYHLFKTAAITTLIHPESLIHSMVMFVDGSIKAQISVPDMKQVLNYFLNYEQRQSFPKQKNLDFKTNVIMNLQEIDVTRFVPIQMAMACLNENNTKAIAMNAANEVCVSAFLAGELSFASITEVVAEIFINCIDDKLTSYEAIVAFDAQIRAQTQQKIREEIV